MNKCPRPLWCTIPFVFLMVHEVQAGAIPGLSATANWDSKYVTEGRDNLGEGGLISGSVSFEWVGFGFGGWYADGTDVDYSEVNFTVNRGFKLGPIELGVSYTRLEFPGVPDLRGDDEIGAFAGTGLPAGLRVEAGARYSTEADGSFVEVVLRRPWVLGPDGVLLVPYAMQAFDLGYASEAFDGPNHFELGATLELPLSKQVSVSVYISHAFAQRDVKNDGLGDVTWGGVGVAVAF